MNKKKTDKRMSAVIVVKGTLKREQNMMTWMVGKKQI